MAWRPPRLEGRDVTVALVSTLAGGLLALAIVDESPERRSGGEAARLEPFRGRLNDLDLSLFSREAGRPASPAARRTSRRAGFGLERIGRFDQPVFLAQPPGERRRLFVVEKTGRVRIVRDGRVLRRPFLSLRGRVSQATEQGLLSIAFSPDYRRSRLFYVAFTNRRGNIRVVEYRRSRRSADRADRFSERTVMRIHHPRKTHNGGLLVFGPDGHLYIGVGDGGGPGDPGRNGQDRGTLLGKLLRIDPHPRGRRRYTVPRGNPFARLRGARDEIYAYGLRNPWRFSFDPITRDLWIGDVGQERKEEIDVVSRRRARGSNFGWSAWEGRLRFNPRLRARNHVRPIHQYTHGPACSVTGGHVVRDPALGKRLWGRYIYGDFCTGRISSIRRSLRAPAPRYEHVRVPLLASFAQDRFRRLYAISLAGPVYRLTGR